jgi:hypothetical protein
MPAPGGSVRSAVTATVVLCIDPDADTVTVKDALAARPGGTWRPWTIWLPCVLAFIWSILLIVADGLAGVMGSWDTPMPGLGWIKVGMIGHCALAAASVVVLVAGLRFPSRRRAAVIAAWMIIPAGIGWLLLVGRLVSGS